MKLYPVSDKVVVQMLEAEDTTKNGIILPTTSKGKSQIAKVVAVGPGENIDGKEILMTAKVGDQVVINKYSGAEVKIDNVEYIIIKMHDILAVVK